MQKRPAGPNLHPVQHQGQPIVSIMQKRPPGPSLTSCSKSRPFCHQHNAEKTFWALTYKLFKTQTILSSASCRKGLWGPDLHTVQNPEQPIVRIMQNRPSRHWLTCCWKSRAAHCQDHAEKASWTSTYILLETQTAHCQRCAGKAFWPSLTYCSKIQWLIVSIMQKRPSGPPTLTYKLFKTQRSPLSASCRKSLLDSDLQPVHNPEQLNVSICVIKAFWSLTYMLLKTQSPLSAA